MIFVSCKGGERRYPFIGMYMTPQCPFLRVVRHRISGHELNIKSIQGAEIILIAYKNCHVPGNFAYCSHNSLKHIFNSEYILGINDDSFKWCSQLESFTFNNNIEVLPSEAFSGCSKLKIAQLPSKLRVLGDYCFSGCRNISNLTLPKTLKIIKAGAFRNSGLESIRIPLSVTSIHERAFSDCKSMKTASIPLHLKPQDKIFKDREIYFPKESENHIENTS